MPSPERRARGTVRAMKTYKAYKTHGAALSVAAALLAVVSSPMLRGADTYAAPERIGTYDSRVVAYAYFSSDANLRRIGTMVKDARDAKAAGEMERFRELDTRVKNEQRRIHLQAFSTASVTNILTEIKDRLPAIEKRAGVSLLISKWNTAALKRHPHARRVDVTDTLAKVFKPDEKRWKMIASIKRSKPIPLKRMERMEDE